VGRRVTRGHDQCDQHPRHPWQPASSVLQQGGATSRTGTTPRRGHARDLRPRRGSPFNEDDEQTLPARVVELKARVREADAILIATPEYNYSVPGVLKNAIDWGSRPYGDNVWDGKPVAIMGASPGPLGTARAQYHLRQSFVFLNMYPVNRPEVMISNAAQRFDAQGRLADEGSRTRIRQLLEALVAWTRRLRMES